ncbi:SAVED domain-containing protein [Actinophytocola sediminis]
MDVDAGRAADTETLIFVNYRGRDAGTAAAFVHTELSRRFGAAVVFLDYESIPLGRDFQPVLLSRVRSSAVLLAIIGDRWLEGVVGQRSIDDPDDWVRNEILEALRHKVPVVPVLFDGATLSVDRLPPELAELINLQYFQIRTRRQRHDISGLADHLAREIPRLRDLPVHELSPWEALVAVLQDGMQSDTGSGVTISIEVNEAGDFDQVSLRRPVAMVVDRQIGHDPQLFHDMVRAAGLRDNGEADRTVRNWMRGQLAQGHTVIDRAAIEDAVAKLDLMDSQPRAVLSIATLKPDLMAERADYALDWVDRFEGDSAYLKRRPRAPSTWVEFQVDIEAIPANLPTGRSEVLVTGSLRQATAFAVGGALRMVTGRDIAVNQRGELWSSNAHFDVLMTPSLAEHCIEKGDELAVAISVAADPVLDVLAFIGDAGLPVDRLVSVSPVTGIRDNAIPDAGTAAAFAQGCRDAVRMACRRNTRIHLFLAGPMGLALLLGHRWNRLRPTVVYEDVQGRAVYEKAFTIDA